MQTAATKHNTDSAMPIEGRMRPKQGVSARASAGGMDAAVLPLLRLPPLPELSAAAVSSSSPSRLAWRLSGGMSIAANAAPSAAKLVPERRSVGMPDGARDSGLGT